MGNHIVNGGELYHWKYIRREKMPNGKYRYYYDKDNNKLKAVTTKKKMDSLWIGDNRVDTHYVRTTERSSDGTTRSLRVVDEDTYNKTEEGTKWSVGNRPLSSVTKEQISVGASFIKDLFSGNVYTKKRK